jgi:hypothetical protein
MATFTDNKDQVKRIMYLKSLDTCNHSEGCTKKMHKEPRQLCHGMALSKSQMQN